MKGILWGMAYPTEVSCRGVRERSRDENDQNTLHAL